MHTSYIHDFLQGLGRSQIHLDVASQCTSGTQYSIWQQHCILKHSASLTSGSSCEENNMFMVVTDSWVGK